MPSALLGLGTDALHIVLNEIGHPVVLMTTEGLILEANDATARLLLGDGNGAALRYCPFLHQQDGLPIEPGFLGEVIAQGRRQERELQRFGRWWQIHLVPLHETEDNVGHLLLIAHDITSVKERQQVELTHQKNLTAVLLREVHHRIKNNLQGVVGLLRSHSRSTQSLDDVIRAASTQVRAIAAVHGLLSEHAGSVVFEDLMNDIVQSSRGTSPIPISLQSSGVRSSLLLREDDAVPLAVSMAELLTNAIKHTTPTATAHIAVNLDADDNAVELRISNGPAQLPEGFQLPPPEAPPSGLVLVQALLPRDHTTLDIYQDGLNVTTLLQVSKHVEGI